MRTVLSLPIERDGTLPDRFPDDLRFPDQLVSTLLERYTEPGDTVLDPFAGFGTVLKVAGDLDRSAHGLEYDADKVDYARAQLELGERSTLVQGNALEFTTYDFPEIECCITSPPFATDGMAVDPLRNYAGESSYEAYLEDLRDVFSQIDRRMRSGGRIVLEISNLQTEDGVATLAWDVADALSEVLSFGGEVIVSWEGTADDGYDGDGIYGYGYDHSYCLVFEAGDS